jgi:ribonuclease HI
MKRISIYTDGACSGNPGPGGWGAILSYGSIEKEMTGNHPQTTNNRMELTAIVVPLESLNYPCDVTIYSDSAYCVDAINKGWLLKWMKEGIHKRVNYDLWERFMTQIKISKVTMVKVKGHSTDAMNNRVDRLATGAIIRK